MEKVDAVEVRSDLLMALPLFCYFSSVLVFTLFFISLASFYFSERKEEVQAFEITNFCSTLKHIEGQLSGIDDIITGYSFDQQSTRDWIVMIVIVQIFFLLFIFIFISLLTTIPLESKNQTLGLEGKVKTSAVVEPTLIPVVAQVNRPLTRLVSSPKEFPV